MTILKICGLALIVCVCGLITNQILPDMSKAVMAVSGVILTGFALAEIIPVVDFLSSINSGVRFPEYLKLMLKGAGTAVVCETVSDICVDCGNKTAAGKVELAGKIQLIALSIPLVKEIINTGANLLSA